MLVLPNLHDIMNLNSDEMHMTHKLAKYFEIQRDKRSVLHLIRPKRNRKTLHP